MKDTPATKIIHRFRSMGWWVALLDGYVTDEQSAWLEENISDYRISPVVGRINFRHENDVELFHLRIA